MACYFLVGTYDINQTLYQKCSLTAYIDVE